MMSSGGEIVYEKNAEEPALIASTTKLMTALVMLDKEKYRGTIRISKNAASTPWKHFDIKEGEKWTTHWIKSREEMTSSLDQSRKGAQHVQRSRHEEPQLQGI